MTTHRSTLIKGFVAAAAALTVLGHPGAHAESTYGYSPTGGAVSASAKVNIQVNVPKLILLRVGTSGATIDTVTLSALPNPGIPGGVAAAALTAGNSQASDWDGTAPVLAAAPSAAVSAFAWTNATGAVLNGALTGLASPAGVTGTMIIVASSGALEHPGNNLANNVTKNFGPNAVATGTWTYSITSADLATVPAGQYTGQMTYTASAL
jgi:hypothetical protein